MPRKKLDPNFSNEKILEVIRDYSNDTIYFKDSHSRFVWNNRSHAAQFGVSDPREMKGKTDANYFPKDFAGRARKEELEIMDTRIPLISNIEKLEKPDGSVVWYSASKYPIIDDKDKVIGTWGISRNITALKIVEEELSRTNEKLKRLSQVDDLTGLFNRRYFYEMIEKTASAGFSSRGIFRFILFLRRMSMLFTMISAAVFHITGSRSALLLQWNSIT